MLVKVAEDIFNMTVLESVQIFDEPNMVVKKGRFFDRKEQDGIKYALVLFYKDIHNKSNEFTLYGITTFQEAAKYRDEVIEQAKELEVNQATQLLEEAIRKS
jgi:hypothetical protein